MSWNTIVLHCQRGRQGNESLGNLELPAIGMAGATPRCDRFIAEQGCEQTGSQYPHVLESASDAGSDAERGHP